MKIVAVILTLNERVHLRRCVMSLKEVAAHIVVVDSFSADGTAELAEELGATIIQRHFRNHSDQFNWALTQLDTDTDWVLRIDADEVITPALAHEIRARLPTVGPDCDGVYWSRRMTFLGHPIRHGGVFPVRVLRLFRRSRGRCEYRWMDEHIVVRGPTVDFKGEMVDDNLNSLTWWTDKHNKYASREAVDLLNLEYGFAQRDSVANLKGGRQAEIKRWIKEEVYARLPRGLRAFGYFFYRYVVMLGFLDGARGTAFHVLQAFWYRYLVDAKVAEVRQYMRTNGVTIDSAIAVVLGIDVSDNCRGSGAAHSRSVLPDGKLPEERTETAHANSN